MKKTSKATVLALALIAQLTILPVGAASAAAKCPIVSKRGELAGSIKVDDKHTWIEAVTYPAGGELLPPVSTEVAGLSKRHQKLSATVGNSVIVWHKDLNGCVGRLDPLAAKKVGFIFSVADELGVIKKYKITKIEIVKVGAYKKSWFYLSGARRLVLITCHGKIVNKHYQQNQVIFASPVK